jgi:hypothetical protein
MASQSRASTEVPPIWPKNVGSSKSKKRSWSRRSCHASMAEDR